MLHPRKLGFAKTYNGEAGSDKIYYNVGDGNDSIDAADVDTLVLGNGSAALAASQFNFNTTATYTETNVNGYTVYTFDDINTGGTLTFTGDSASVDVSGIEVLMFG